MAKEAYEPQRSRRAHYGLNFRLPLLHFEVDTRDLAQWNVIQNLEREKESDGGREGARETERERRGRQRERDTENTSEGERE